jgi:hypothetical protein
MNYVLLLTKLWKVTDHDLRNSGIDDLWNTTKNSSQGIRCSGRDSKLVAPEDTPQICFDQPYNECDTSYYTRMGRSFWYTLSV